VFGPEQILVLYTENLQANPAGTLDWLLHFIDLESGFRPETLGEVLHRGGGSNRVPHGVRVWLRERRVLYRLWQLLPESRRGRLRFLYEQWNVRPEPAPEPGMSPDTEASLRRHFARDLVQLTQLPVETPPWLDRYLPG
jgi:hypothetical protein